MSRIFPIPFMSDSVPDHDLDPPDTGDHLDMRDPDDAHDDEF